MSDKLPLLQVEMEVIIDVWDAAARAGAAVDLIGAASKKARRPL